jgi:outer membrane protein
MNSFLKYGVFLGCFISSLVFANVTTGQQRLQNDYHLTTKDLPTPLPQGWDNRVAGVFFPAAISANGLPLPQKVPTAVKKLSLNDAIAIMLRDNPDVISANAQTLSDKYQYAINAQAYGMKLDDLGINLEKDSGTKRSLSFAPGASLELNNQMGSNVKLSYTPALEHGGQSTGSFTIKQNLLKGAITNHLNYLDNEDSVKSNHIKYMSSVEQVVNQVILAYVQQAQRKVDYQNQVVNLQQQKQQLDQEKRRVKDGKVAPSDLRQQESSYLSSQVNVAKQKISLANGKADFFKLLGLSPGETAAIDAKINTAALISHVPTEDNAIKLALLHNYSYQTQKLSMSGKQRDIMRKRDAMRLGLDLSYTHNFGHEQGVAANIATLSLSVPLDTLTQRNNLLTSRIEYEMEKLKLRDAKQSLVRAIREDYQALDNDKSQLLLDKKNTDLKAAILKDMQLKFKYGKTTSFEVVSLRQQWVLQQQSYVATQMQYFLDVNKLHHDMGDELSLWKIKLRY